VAGAAQPRSSAVDPAPLLLRFCMPCSPRPPHRSRHASLLAPSPHQPPCDHALPLLESRPLLEPATTQQPCITAHPGPLHASGQVNDRGQIVFARDIVEPTIKPGASALGGISAVAPLVSRRLASQPPSKNRESRIKRAPLLTCPSSVCPSPTAEVHPPPPPHPAPAPARCANWAPTPTPRC
jgi:hypothetical protein